jgi:hypothetical protein
MVMEMDKAAAQANAGQGDDWDGIIEDQTQEEPKAQEPVVTEEERKLDEQRKRSDLGRKVKDQSERIDKLTEQNQQLVDAITRLEAHLTGNKKTEVNPTSDLYDQMVTAAGEPPVEFVTTPRESYLYRQWESRAMAILQESSQKVYRENYLTTLNTLKDMGGEVHEEVVKMVTSKGSPFNVYRDTGRGDVDARMNYLEAINSLAKKGGKGSFNNSSTKGAGVSNGASSSQGSSKTTNLTKDAAEYAKFLGLSDDEIAEAMKRPVGRVG